jgi:hypothetical protein
VESLAQFGRGCDVRGTTRGASDVEEYSEGWDMMLRDTVRDGI